MTTKIQINSLEALERLIGGDSELEMEVRSSVANAMAEKHLKSTIRQMAEAGLTDTVRALVETEMLETIPDPRKPSYYSNTIKVLKPAIRAQLASEFDRIIGEEIRSILSTTRASLLNQLNEGLDKIAKEVTNSLQPRITDQIITEKVRAKLANL